MKLGFTVHSSSIAQADTMADDKRADRAIPHDVAVEVEAAHDRASQNDSAELARILRRLAFAAHPDRLEQFAGLAPAEVVERMLREAPLDPTPPWLGGSDDAGRITQWWLDVMRRGDVGVHEKMVWFWHGHFTSSLDKASPSLMLRQHLLLRKHALGNFRLFMHDIVRDAAMLLWLDGAGSTSDAPNQNFAREAMELFALGRQGAPYTEDDVRAGAGAFSGWSVDGENADAVRFDPDAGPKGAIRFLGTTVRSAADAVNAICDHPACAPFVAGRIDMFLVGEEPDDDRRAALAKVFSDAGLDIRALVEHIVRDPKFTTSRVNRLRSALEWFVAVQIFFDVRIDASALEELGQVPFLPPNVAGWPGTNRWVSAGAEFTKAQLALDNTSDTSTLNMTDPVADVLRRAALFDVSDATLATLRQAASRVNGRRDTSTLLHSLVAVSPEFSLA